MSAAAEEERAACTGPGANVPCLPGGTKEKAFRIDSGTLAFYRSRQGNMRVCSISSALKERTRRTWGWLALMMRARTS